MLILAGNNSKLNELEEKVCLFICSSCVQAVCF